MPLGFARRWRSGPGMTVGGVATVWLAGGGEAVADGGVGGEGVRREVWEVWEVRRTCAAQ